MLNIEYKSFYNHIQPTICTQIPVEPNWYNTNSIYILVQKNHAKPLWRKGTKNTIGLF